MLQGVLAENGLDITKCVGNATDGAANMQGNLMDFLLGLRIQHQIKFTFGAMHIF
jgi:hypothetical protein